MLRIWSILSTRIVIRKKTVKAIHQRCRKKNKSMQSWRWITFFSLELFFFPAESFSEKYIQITSKGGENFDKILEKEDSDNVITVIQKRWTLFAAALGLRPFTREQLEMHDYVLSTVATYALVIKDLAISIYNAD